MPALARVQDKIEICISDSGAAKAWERWTSRHVWWVVNRQFSWRFPTSGELLLLWPLSFAHIPFLASMSISTLGCAQIWDPGSPWEGEKVFQHCIQPSQWRGIKNIGGWQMLRWLWSPWEGLGWISLALLVRVQSIRALGGRTAEGPPPQRVSGYFLVLVMLFPRVWPVIRWYPAHPPPARGGRSPEICAACPLEINGPGDDSDLTYPLLLIYLSPCSSVPHAA